MRITNLLKGVKRFCNHGYYKIDEFHFTDDAEKSEAKTPANRKFYSMTFNPDH